jgi:hypothetical protein
VGVVSVGGPRPLNAASLAFTSDAYLLRQHGAWMFECAGTRFHDPESEGEGQLAYGVQWGAGDVVSVVVDLEATTSPGRQVGTLRLVVNGEDQGVGFSGLRGHELVPVVWLYGPGDCLECLGYSGPLSSGPAAQAGMSSTVK